MWIHHCRILQTGQHSQAGLARVLHAEQLVFRPPGVFGASPAVCAKQHLAPVQPVEQVRHGQVADEFQMPCGVQAVGPARIARDEHQLVVFRSRRAPLQILIDLGRLVVLVHAEERNIQIVARILEIIRISAEKRDVLLRREYQRTSVYFL